MKVVDLEMYATIGLSLKKKMEKKEMDEKNAGREMIAKFPILFQIMTKKAKHLHTTLLIIRCELEMKLSKVG